MAERPPERSSYLVPMIHRRAQLSDLPDDAFVDREPDLESRRSLLLIGGGATAQRLLAALAYAWAGSSGDALWLPPARIAMRLEGLAGAEMDALLADFLPAPIVAADRVELLMRTAPGALFLLALLEARAGAGRPTILSTRLSRRSLGQLDPLAATALDELEPIRLGSSETCPRETPRELVREATRAEVESFLRKVRSRERASDRRETRAPT